MIKSLKLIGFSNKGYGGQAIGIETVIRNGFPTFEIIGLADSAIKESKERVRCALSKFGFKFPQSHVIVSLSPASVPKSGSLLDLGIALSIIFAANSKTESDEILTVMTAGELSLDGRIIEDPSTLGAINCAHKAGCDLILVPFHVDSNIHPDVIQVADLSQAFMAIGEALNNPTLKAQTQHKQNTPSIFNNIIGMENEKYILALCAAGWHSVLFFGPMGVGKTMLCNSLHELLPDLSVEDKEQVDHIYGCANITRDYPERPVNRILSHDCTMTQFTGSLSSKAPGEGALAHNGIIILDELNKYTPKLRDGLKDTYDTGLTVSSNTPSPSAYPARFLMAANMNVCPCADLGNPNGTCTCTTQQIANYWKKIGKPLIERFDIRFPVQQTDFLMDDGEPTHDLSFYQNKIMLAIERQKVRYADYSDVKLNGNLHLHSNLALTILSREMQMLSHLNDNKHPFDTRTLVGIASIARTMADLDDREDVTEDDLLNARTFKKFCLGDYFWRTI